MVQRNFLFDAMRNRFYKAHVFQNRIKAFQQNVYDVAKISLFHNIFLQMVKKQAVASSGCKKSFTSGSKPRRSQMVSDAVNNRPLKRIIVDTDGGCDDALALFMLLRADDGVDVQVEAVTCVNGNTSVDKVANNVLRVLGTAGRLDIPVFKGAAEELIPFRNNLYKFYGIDGFGDIFQRGVDDSLLNEEHAVHALNRIVSAMPGEITLMPIGPLTNIALAIKLYPDFTAKLKEIYINGGNYKGVGNASNCAEFNFLLDPEAAHIVLNNSACPIIMTPLETALECEMSLEWRFNQMASCRTPQAELMNVIEEAVYKDKPNEMYIPHDAVCAAVLLNHHTVLDYSNNHATVEISGYQSRGQMIIDHQKQTPANVTIVTMLQRDIVKDMLLYAVGDNINVDLARPEDLPPSQKCV